MNEKIGVSDLKKYFSEYINSLIKLLESDSADTEYLMQIKKELLIKIEFMQHERLIHLLVTILFAVVMFLTLIIFFQSELFAFLAITMLCLVLLIFYIAHYFFLENGVQQLYKLYDRLCGKISSN